MGIIILLFLALLIDASAQIGEVETRNERTANMQRLAPAPASRTVDIRATSPILGRTRSLDLGVGSGPPLVGSPHEDNFGAPAGRLRFDLKTSTTQLPSHHLSAPS